MNFFEAMKELENGKTVIRKKKIHNTEDLFYHLINDVLVSSLSPRKEAIITRSTENFNELNTYRWEIYEEPKPESKRVWERPGYLNIGMSRNSDDNRAYPTQTLGVFNKIEERDAWAVAIDTFMLLKGHPLAKKPEQKQQWIIRVAAALDTLFVARCEYDNIGYKIDYISPIFDNIYDCNKAIVDIGKENLLHMFNTFQGIYE